MDTTELLGYKIEKKEVFAVFNADGNRVITSESHDSAEQWVKKNYVNHSLGFSSDTYEIAYSNATGMFDLYCANPNRDDDYWFGGKNYDLNFCCDEDGVCSVTLYRVKADSSTDTSKFMRLFERNVSVVPEQADPSVFQSTVQLKGSTYNLTIKEDVL